jgi:two-component system sensor histidine kinase ChvG
MSLRAKLLLLSLLTLILPWAGWQYAEQMETTLRRGQEQALLTTAEVLSRVVASEPEHLYRVPELRERFDPQRGDLFAPLLTTQPLADGFADEWPMPSRAVIGFDDAVPRLRLGIYRRHMHAYVAVKDASITYEEPTQDPALPSAADRVIFLTRDEYGHERAWAISAIAPGPIIARSTEIGAPWRAQGEELAHITGIWRETESGYAIELRAPVNTFGTQLAVLAIDGAAQTSTPIQEMAWLHGGSEALKQFAPRGLRVSVVDNKGWLLARAGSLISTAQRNEDDLVRFIYQALLEGREAPVHPYGLPYGMWGSPVDSARDGKTEAIWFMEAGGEPSAVRAAVPITFGGSNSAPQVLGALVVEQPAEELVLIRELSLRRLINFTLLATLFSIVVTLVFAARLSQRIRRLSRAASTALTPEGRIDPDIPDTDARDELGALARNYSLLLGRLKEYTNYLQTLGTKLSHELRTPLTITSSSLENLSSEAALAPEAQSYLERARHGTARMHAILTAMTEATRVEQSIEHTERTEFDLTELVRHMGQAYRETFARHRVETVVPDFPCRVVGSPDLIAQLLDKLMDNAADFCPSGGLIQIALEADARTCRLSVSNEGPRLPPHLTDRVFESLVSGRTTGADRPHLGLGLYIVRLIADFHHGTVTAADLPDDSGVVFTLELARR